MMFGTIVVRNTNPQSKKRLIKNVDKYTKLFKPSEEILELNYCLSVYDNI